MELFRFRTEEEWVEAARGIFRAAAVEAEARGSAVLRLCLAGGQTPEPVYRALARIPLRGLRVELWLGDERDVLPDSPDRNGNLILRAFRDRDWDPEPDFMLWPEGPAAEACRSMETRLAALVQPFFDLSFLGVGEDGHTAGIFPGGPELEESARLAVPSRAPAEPRARMTLTFPALASTRRLWFLLRGPSKLGLAELLSEPRGEGGPFRDGDGCSQIGGPSRDDRPGAGARAPVPAELLARRVGDSGGAAALLYCET